MTMTLEEARRLALASGAALEINGKVFNASRQKVDARPAPKPAPVVEPQPVRSVEQPVAASAPSITRDEVESLLAARDAFWMAEMQRLTQTIAETFAAHRPMPGPPVSWTFTPKYDRANVLTKIEATPNAVRH